MKPGVITWSLMLMRKRKQQKEVWSRVAPHLPTGNRASVLCGRRNFNQPFARFYCCLFSSFFEKSSEKWFFFFDAINFILQLFLFYNREMRDLKRLKKIRWIVTDLDGFLRTRWWNIFRENLNIRMYVKGFDLLTYTQVYF